MLLFNEINVNKQKTNLFPLSPLLDFIYPARGLTRNSKQVESSETDEPLERWKFLD